MISCKEAGVLAEKMGENKLTMSEKMKLMYHVIWCKNCRRFKKQIDWINGTLKEIDIKAKFTPEEKEELGQKINPELG